MRNINAIKYICKIYNKIKYIYIFTKAIKYIEIRSWKQNKRLIHFRGSNT